MYLPRHWFVLTCVLIMISRTPAITSADQVYSPGKIIKSSHQNQAVEPQPYAAAFSRIISIDYQEQTLDKVLEDLTKQLDCPVYIDWVSLLNVGVEKELPITLHLEKTPLRKVLERVLAIASAQNELDPLWYDVQQNVIRISHKRNIFISNQPTIIYDVYDLIADDPTINQPSQINDNGLIQIGGEQINHLMVLIRKQTAPLEYWVDYGGDYASIHPLNTKLIITGHPTIHRNIRKLLADLRQHAQSKLIAKTPAPKHLVKELSLPINLDLKNSRFDDALSFISNTIHVPIHVDWASLKELRVEPGTRLSVSINHTTVGIALDLILEQATFEMHREPIWHDESAESISVSSQSKLLKLNQYTQMYDIRKFLPVVDAVNPDPDVDERRRHCVEKLCDLIRQTIYPSTWEKYGGTISSMSYVNDKLIIKTHPVIHDQILKLLQSLLM